MSVAEDNSTQRIGLADAIAELRSELSKAKNQTKTGDIRFAIGEIEVDLSIEFSASRSVEGGVKVFSLVDLGAKGGDGTKAMHKLKLKLTIDPSGGPTSGLITDEMGPPPAKSAPSKR